MTTRRFPIKAILASASSAAILGVMYWVCRAISKDTTALAYTLLIAVTGGVLGWLVGFLASPYTTQESERFTQTTKAITAFLGGFVLSKTDSLISSFFAQDPLIENPVYGARLLVFVVFLVGAAINTYIVRSYLHRSRRDFEADRLA